ncbi:hypothetical protein I6E29_00870 [Arcanobacterium haemolyticum]|nr:hypothetical protein [Arcanobacterium haemolyticum]
MHNLAATHARKLLHHITQWRTAYADTADIILGISSPKLSYTTAPSTGGGLTEKIASTLDDTSLGAEGIKTEEGLHDILNSWAKSFAFDRCETYHDPYTYLTTDGVLEWATHQADWSAFLHDIENIHTKLATLAGYAPIPIGTCPRPTGLGRCGGTITATQTRDGRTDYGTCERCDTWYANEEDIQRATKAAARLESRQTTDMTILVTMSDLAQIWDGTVDKNTLKTWSKRGHLTPSGTIDGKQAYRLAIANIIIKTRLEQNIEQGVP